MRVAEVQRARRRWRGGGGVRVLADVNQHSAMRPWGDVEDARSEGGELRLAEGYPWQQQVTLVFCEFINGVVGCLVSGQHLPMPLAPQRGVLWSNDPAQALVRNAGIPRADAAC